MNGTSLPRTSGILLHPTSLPSPYGIGDLGRSAYEFIDFLAQAGQHLWQVLPLTHTGFGDSPYQSFSAFAGQPLLISPAYLQELQLVSQDDLNSCPQGDPTQVDYGAVIPWKNGLLRKAFQSFQEGRASHLNWDFENFCREQDAWLSDYSLFMSMKDCHEGRCWLDWPEDCRRPDPDKKAALRAELTNESRFYAFVQFLFFREWMDLKRYANEKGVRIIGDIPIYVAFDSADTWANPELFQFDENGLPTAVAGCPPDAFSATGQLWGNPLYAWDYHKKTGYDWWMKRVACCFKLYDIIRIDHFRGFDEYYAIPYGDETAENGEWMPGPGMDLFRTMKETLGDLPIIAEDLGFLTDTVRQLLKDSGYPGMKVLEFAFVAGEDSDYLPHNYDKNCVVYTGTHDNDTLQGWYQTLSEEDKEMTKEYLNNPYTPDEEVHWDFISLAMRSVADTCIIPVQDYLGLGNKARINMPSTLGSNWMWRMKKGAFTDELIKKIRKTTEVCAR